MKNRSLFLGLVMLGALVPRAAHADDRRAEELYQEGRRAAQAHDWPLACKKFAESQEREPAPGTLLNLADCEENRGKLTDAITHFESASKLFGTSTDRGVYAKQRAQAAERKIPKLVLRLQASSPSGTTVDCDGVAVDSAQLGRPMRVTSGEHVIVVRSPGRSDVRSTVAIAVGEARELELAVGTVTPTNAEPSPVAKTAGRASEPRTTPQAFPSTVTKDGASPMWTAGFVSLGIGAVSLGIGILGGLETMNAKSVADNECKDGCTPAGQDAQASGKTWSAVSTAGFIGGATGLLAGVGLLVLAPRSSRATAVGARPVTGGSEILFTGNF